MDMTEKTSRCSFQSTNQLRHQPMDGSRLSCTEFMLLFSRYRRGHSSDENIKVLKVAKFVCHF